MRSFFQMLFALLTLAAMIWATWQGYLLLRQEQLGLDPGVRSILVISAIFAIICAFIISSAIGTHADKTFRASQFPNRMAVYSRFIGIYQALSGELPEGQTIKLDVDLKGLEEEFILLASAKVLKTFYEWKKESSSEGINTLQARSRMQKLLLAMREDLGQPADYFIRKEIQHTVNK